MRSSVHRLKIVVASTAVSIAHSLFVVVLVHVVLLTGCSGPGTANSPVESPPAAPPPPDVDVLQRSPSGMRLVSLISGAAITAPMTGDVVFSSLSPDYGFLAAAVENADSSWLVLFDRSADRSFRLSAGDAGLVYTGSWSPESDRFAFGYYRPDGKRMGAGDIEWAGLKSTSSRQAKPDDTGRSTASVQPAVQRVGCSSSRAVLGWLPDGSLLVRNSDNLYVVSIDGCRTIRTIDARKMYALSPSPDGSSLAFVRRELVFNRAARTYDPDSTLFLASVLGEAETRVVGDKYKPRHPAWSPDGSELAYDVVLQDASGTRAISIFSLTSGQSSFLVPPESDGPSREHPVWSPTGRQIMFRISTDGGKPSFGVKASGQRFVNAVPWDSGSTFPVAAEWVDDARVVLIDALGTRHLADLERGLERPIPGNPLLVLSKRTQE